MIWYDQVRHRGSVSLAEIGTLQLEMLYLSYLTKVLLTPLLYPNTYTSQDPQEGEKGKELETSFSVCLHSHQHKYSHQHTYT